MNRITTTGKSLYVDRSMEGKSAVYLPIDVSGVAIGMDDKKEKGPMVLLMLPGELNLALTFATAEFVAQAITTAIEQHLAEAN